MSTWKEIFDPASLSLHVGDGQSVLPGFILGQAAMTIFSGAITSHDTNQQSEREKEFMERLSAIRHSNEENRTMAEIAFLNEYQKRGLQHQYESAIRQCEQHQRLEEFRHFCQQSWNTRFRPSVSAVLEEMRQQTNPNVIPQIKLLVARTPVIARTQARGIDPLTSYSRFCNEISNGYIERYDIAIDTIWLQAWNSDCISAMADTLNLRYIMRGLPTIIVYPLQRGDMLSLETATWGYQLGIKELVLDKMFKVPMTEIENTPRILKNLVLAAACYIDDCYRLLFYHTSVDSLPKIKEALKDDDLTLTLLKRKCAGLMAVCQRLESQNLIENEKVVELKELLER